MLESTSRVLEVAAPSRLHFGLLSFGRANHVNESLRDSPSRESPTVRVDGGRRESDDRHFGGAGVMIDQPGVLLRFWPADRLTAAGPLADRVLEFARRFVGFHRLPGEPRRRIEVVRTPREHVGLGVGTSVGMSVAAGLAKWLGFGATPAEQLAASVGRGRRSAVGTHGFLHGGLIVEAGKSSAEEIAPLLERLELPLAWRFMLLCPAGEGLSGAAEEQVFHRLSAMSDLATLALRDELLTQLLPAAQRGDFAAFSESLYRFNRAAGECYAPYQSGPYANPKLAELVTAVREAGVRGVGQSSWGPTVFALLPDQASAERFVATFAKSGIAERTEATITPISRRGAMITWREAPT